MKVVSFDEYVSLYKETTPKIAKDIKAFYNHELGVICTDARALLMPMDDHMVHRGDAVFESLACTNGKIFHIDKHLSRLENSMASIGLSCPVSSDELRRIINEVAKVAAFQHGNIRVFVGRGRGSFGVNPYECDKSSLYIIALESNTYDKTKFEKGYTATHSKIPVKQKYLARIKSTNYLPNALMAKEAQDNGVDLVFAFDDKGHLAESSVCNVAMYKDGTFYFPKFDNILIGTTVLLAIRIAEELGKVRLTDITDNMLYEADEIFAIGSSYGCISVVKYDHRPVGKGNVGDMAKILREKLLERLTLDGITI